MPTPQLAEPRCGRSEPTLELYPDGDFDFSFADEALRWCDDLGLTLFDWQRAALRKGLAIDGGRWAVSEITLVVPRQNGKNEILIALELIATHLLRRRSVIHSAHEAVTSTKHFQRFEQLADPDHGLTEVAKLMPATKNRGFYAANGKEHITFRNGADVDFRTRSRKAGRGFSVPLVVMDEAFDLPPKAESSLRYTIRAKRNAQLWKTSSPAHETSVVLHSDRARALDPDPQDSRFFYAEWANDPDCDPADPETWYRSNPSVNLTAPGFELTESDFWSEYSSARRNVDQLHEFVREVCGVPDKPLGEGGGPIPLDRWNDLVDRTKLPEDVTVRLALDAPPDRTSATFAVAGRRADGLTYVEVRRHLPSADMGSLVVEAKRLSDGHGTPLVLPPSSPAKAWKAELLEAGVELDELTPAEYAEACGAMQVAVADGGLRHGGQPELASAVAGLAAKATGDVETWSRRNSSANIAPFVAATCALGRVPELVEQFFAY